MVSANDSTFDTCVAIKILENPNVGGMLSCRINFADSTVHLSSQTVSEARRLGYDVDSIYKQIKKSIGAKVVLGTITDEMAEDAAYLETMYPTLHNGDSQILAYARATNTTLVTCDKGLAEAARISGTTLVNPDLLPCDKIRLHKKSKMQKIVDKAVRKPSEVKQKIKSLALKPGQKIVWRSFQ